MNSERIKEIQQGTTYPNSVSVQQALLQVWNECEQEKNLQSKGKTKSVEGSDVLSFLSNSKRQFAKECGCERCLEILSIHEREEYAQSHANKDGFPWIKFDSDLIETYPKKYDKYLICRKDGKIHWETWNGSGWAYNHNEIRYYAEIIPPQI